MPINAEAGKTYQAAFAYPSGSPVPEVQTPKTLDALGYRLELIGWQIAHTERKLYITFRVTEKLPDAGNYVQGDTTHSPVTGENRPAVVPLAVPVSALVLASLAVLGIAMLYLTLVEVKEVVITPAGSAMTYALIAGGVFFLWQFLKKQT